MAKRKPIKWGAESPEVIARSGNRCWYCGDNLAAGRHEEYDNRGALVEYWPILDGYYERRTVDHVMPLSRGGSNELNNLVLACRSCNCRKGTLTVDEWRPIAGQPFAFEVMGWQ